jgi:hypothetical protein
LINIGHYRYDINENNEVFMWDDNNPYENNEPFFYQPDHPDGTPWENKEAAETWTVDMLNKLLIAEEAIKNQSQEIIEE